MESAIRVKIEKRAYELFMARGGSHGYHFEDWVKAEKEISSEQKVKKQTEASSTSATYGIGPDTSAKPKQVKSVTGTSTKKKVAKNKSA